MTLGITQFDFLKYAKKKCVRNKKNKNIVLYLLQLSKTLLLTAKNLYTFFNNISLTFCSVNRSQPAIMKNGY